MNVLIAKLTGSAFDGNLNKVKEVLATNPSIIDAKNSRGQTALYCAARNGFVDIVNHLLSNGADPNEVEKNGSTALHAAAYYGKMAIVKALLEGDAKKDAKNNYGSSPEAEALDQGNKAIAEYIKSFTPAPKPPPAKKKKVEAPKAPEVKPPPKQDVVPPSLISQCVKVIAKELTENTDDYLEPLVGAHDEILKLMFSALPYTVLGKFASFTDDSGGYPYKGVISSDSMNKGMKTEEDKYRNYFAQQRDHPALDDPHLMLTKVYDNVSSFVIRGSDDIEKDIPKVFDWALKDSPPVGAPSVAPTKEDFVKRWNVFTEKQLEGLNWDHVFCAGGAPLACAMPIAKSLTDMAGGNLKLNHLRGYYHGQGVHVAGSRVNAGPFRSSVDLDLFLYGFDDDDTNGLNNKLKEIHRVIVENNPNPVLVVRTAQAITFVSTFPYRHVQVVLRSYKSPAEILMGFDLDCATLGYDGKELYCLPRCMRALNWRHNLVDLTRRSTTYESRLFKYARRGFAVACPGLDRSKLKAIPSDPTGLHGLGRMLAIEKLEDERRKTTTEVMGQWGKWSNKYDKKAWFHSLGTKGVEKQPNQIDTVWGKGFANDQFGKEQQAVFESVTGQTAFDYDSVFLPWSPKFNAEKINTLFGYRSLSNSYGNDDWGCYVRSEWSLDSIIGMGDDYGDDEEEEIQGDGPEAQKKRTAKIIKDPLKWLSVDPGRQYIGSFHPESGGWYKDAYDEVPMEMDAPKGAAKSGTTAVTGSGTDASKIHLEFKMGSSEKFWEMSIAGNETTVSFGKIGTSGTTQKKVHASPAAAQEFMSKQAAAKKKKGYK